MHGHVDGRASYDVIAGDRRFYTFLENSHR